MTPPVPFELPPGEYQAAITLILRSTALPGHEAETIVYFSLTEPTEEQVKAGNPQAGLGGRVVRAWFDLDAESPRALDDARAAVDRLLLAVGRAQTLDETLGAVIRIRVARVVSMRDPSRPRTAAVDFLPLHAQNVEYID